MDSGNSGSLQSSSGGDDEEYDSRTDRHPPFVPSYLNSSANPPPPDLSFVSQHLPTTALFDPSSTYLQPLSSHSQQPNSLLNMEFLSSRPPQQSITLGDHLVSGLQSGSLLPDKLPSSDHAQTAMGVRNSKKRTRASRRAPTTVLTTDTSNFRAMVQEFTGIPAPPFSYSRRLDLFGTRSVNLDPLGSSLYPLRPSAHKIQPSAAGNFNSSGSGSNYLKIQNPILSFLQQQPHHHQVGATWRGGPGSTQHQFRASNDTDYNNNSSSASQQINNGAKFNNSDQVPARCDDGAADHSWICPPD